MSTCRSWRSPSSSSSVLPHLLGVTCALFAGRKIVLSKTAKCTNHPALHHLKRSHAGTVSVEEPNHPRRIIRVFEWKIIRCPETGPSKQASLRNSARSLIERRAEPLGNLNKGLPSAPRVAYPLMRHVHAQEPQSQDSTSEWPLLGLLTLPTAASERTANMHTCTHIFPDPPFS